jgi:protein involved in polysaccharide export with SLBB domain
VQPQTATNQDTQAQKIGGASQAGTPTGSMQQGPAMQSAAPNTTAAPDTAAYPDTLNGDPRRADTGAAVVAGTGPTMRRPVYVPNEFEAYVSELADKPVRRLGAELVVPEARGFTSPPDTAIPADYRVNAGDEVVVGLTGSVEAGDLRLVVDKEGQIFVPKIGAITVAGVPYSGLQALIAARVARQYRNFNLTVSLGALRGITVYVTGFVAHPGSYTVSSLSTLVNALLAAGGPAASGSFRSIHVRRGGQLVDDFDLYDFLLKGDNSHDITLQNGDVVFVAPAGAQVAVIGSVNREAIYEARANDTLTDMLVYAGGANTVADLGRVNLLDPLTDGGWQQITPVEASRTPARRGLVVRVLSAAGIAQPERNLQSLVTVSGEVAKPGRYFVKPGTTLDEIVAMAGGLTSEAYPFGAVFVRDSLRREQEVNYARAVEQLQTSLLVQPLVRASSSANQGGDIAGRLAIVNDLIGQLRIHHIDGRLVLPVEPGANRVPGEFVVKNNDELYIPSVKLDVGVFGLVNSSADFQFVVGRRVKDYIRIAGGYARYADSHHVFVERANGMLISGSAALDTPVMPGDLIFVPVNADQGLFWAHLRDISSGLLNGLVAAAAIRAVSQ